MATNLTPFEKMMKYLEDREIWKGTIEIDEILTKETQMIAEHVDLNVLRLFKIIAYAVSQEMRFHNVDDDEAHKKHFGSKLSRLEGRMKNHRHEYKGAFTDKPAY